MSSERFLVSIKGVVPLLMHSPRGTDILDLLVQELKRLTSKPAKKRTLEDEQRISELEWLLGIYANEAGNPIIPGECLQGMVVNGAMQARKGRQAEGAIFCDTVLLQYPGPKTVKGLFENRSFWDRRRVCVNKGSSVMRTRPIFHEWGVDFAVDVDTAVFGAEDLREAIEQGTKIGLLDYRPRFGRFLVTKFERGGKQNG